MKKDSEPKPAKKSSSAPETAPAKNPVKPAGRAKASVKAAVTKVGKVAAGAGNAVIKAAATVRKRATGNPSVAGPAPMDQPVPGKTFTSEIYGAPATIIVRHDAGWGHSLSLRGEGPGLSWETGTPLCSVAPDEWVWVAPTSGNIVFKVLHNDRSWAVGENITASSGETVTVTPIF